MPDEHVLTLRPADQLRADIANVENGLKVIMEQRQSIVENPSLTRGRHRPPVRTSHSLAQGNSRMLRPNLVREQLLPTKGYADRKLS